MSTYWYYECLDHSPPLRAEEEFTQHTDDDHFARGVELANSRPVEELDGYWRSNDTRSDHDRTVAYFDMQATRFLTHHPTCNLGLVNEYGDHRPLPERNAS